MTSNTPTVILLHGDAGVGKTAVANAMAAIYGADVLSFADPIRALLWEVNPELHYAAGDRSTTLRDIGYSLGKRETDLRRVMNFVGNWACLVDPGFFGKALARRVRMPLTVVDDFRFPEEFYDVHSGEWATVTVRLHRFGVDSGLKVDQQLEDWPFSACVDMTGLSIPDAARRVMDIVSEIVG